MRQAIEIQVTEVGNSSSTSEPVAIGCILECNAVSAEMPSRLGAASSWLGSDVRRRVRAKVGERIHGDRAEGEEVGRRR